MVVQFQLFDIRHATELGEWRDGLCRAYMLEWWTVVYIYLPQDMDYCIKGRNRVWRASVADNYRYHFILQSPLPPHSVTLTVIDNKVQLIDVYT